MNVTIAHIALGSNAASPFGPPSATVRAALSALGRTVGRLRAQSRLFINPAVPEGAGPDFVNAIAALETTLAPVILLERLHALEAQFGRHRQVRWGPRTLDLDLIDVAGAVLPDRETWQAWRDLPPLDRPVRAPGRLVLPHPRLQDRAFVLIPLADVAPDWRHPVEGRSVGEMLAALSAAEREAVKPLP